MKKDWKISAAKYIVVAVCTICGLSGCSPKISAKSILGEVSERMLEVSSSANQVEVAVQLKDVLDLREVNLKMNMENTTDPPAGHASGTAEVNIRDTEVSADLEIYQVVENGKFVTYSSMDGVWKKEVSDGANEENHIGIDGNIFAQEGKAMESFRLSEETVSVSGKECYQMYGDVNGEELMGLLGKDMVNAFGLVELPDADAIRKLKVPVIFDVYKTEMLPARIIVDMSEVLNELYDSYGEATKVNLYSVELVFTDYDRVKMVEVPQEVKDAAG